MREQRRKGQPIVAPPPATCKKTFTISTVLSFFVGFYINFLIFPCADRPNYGVGPPPSLMPADEDAPEASSPAPRTKRSNKYGDEGFE